MSQILPSSRTSKASNSSSSQHSITSTPAFSKHIILQAYTPPVNTIKTFCRIRPTPKEQSALNKFKKKGPKTLQVDFCEQKTGKTEKNLDFSFAEIFWIDKKNDAVYLSVCKPVIDDLFSKHRGGLIFVYGVTDSGKTYTMTGGPDAPGILAYSIKYTHDKFTEFKKGEKSASLRCTYIEIYNEEIFDLLNNRNKVKITGNKKAFALQDAVSMDVGDFEEMISAFNIGNANRSMNSTVLNATSSRSHSIFRIELLFTNKTGDSTESASISFVDLAGAERIKKAGTQGEATKEAGFINSSLSVLKRCFEAMEKNSRVSEYYKKEMLPIRESKLTMLFKEYFTGYQNISIICTINPCKRDFNQAINVLRFGTHAQKAKPFKSWELDTGKKNFLSKKDKEIRRLLSGKKSDISSSSSKKNFNSVEKPRNFNKLKVQNISVKKVEKTNIKKNIKLSQTSESKKFKSAEKQKNNVLKGHSTEREESEEIKNLKINLGSNINAKEQINIKTVKISSEEEEKIKKEKEFIKKQEAELLERERKFKAEQEKAQKEKEQREKEIKKQLERAREEGREEEREKNSREHIKEMQYINTVYYDLLFEQKEKILRDKYIKKKKERKAIKVVEPVFKRRILAFPHLMKVKEEEVQTSKIKGNIIEYNIQNQENLNIIQEQMKPEAKIENQGYFNIIQEAEKIENFIDNHDSLNIMYAAEAPKKAENFIENQENIYISQEFKFSKIETVVDNTEKFFIINKNNNNNKLKSPVKNHEESFRTGAEILNKKENCHFLLSGFQPFSNNNKNKLKKDVPSNDVDRAKKKSIKIDEGKISSAKNFVVFGNDKNKNSEKGSVASDKQNKQKNEPANKKNSNDSSKNDSGLSKKSEKNVKNVKNDDSAKIKSKSVPKKEKIEKKKKNPNPFENDDSSDSSSEDEKKEVRANSQKNNGKKVAKKAKNNNNNNKGKKKEIKRKKKMK